MGGKLKISRRKVQIAIGALWFLDGCFQLQPKMFTSNFVTGVIKPAQAGQPFYIYDPIKFGIHIFLSHPAIFNSLIAAVQLAIGLLIIYKASTKYGLWLSAAYGLFVWFAGEAGAGLFSGSASLMMGLPGAALLYTIISLSVLPKKDDKKRPADFWLVFVWAGVWISGAIYQLLPSNNSVGALQSILQNNANGAPGWLSSLDTHLSSYLNHFTSGAHASTMMMNGSTSTMMMGGSNGYALILFIAVVELLIGLGVLMRRRVRQLAIWFGIALSLLFWVVGQSLGGYYTGVMTDVQTAPLLILLGLAILGQPEMSAKLKTAYHKLEKALV